MTTTTTDAIDALVESFVERLEYEVLGAWRAGYSFLHVYHYDSTASAGSLIMRYYVIPSDSEKPPSATDGYRPETFDLRVIDRDMVRRHYGDS